MKALNETEMAQITGGVGGEPEPSAPIFPTQARPSMVDWYLQLIARNPAMTAALGLIRPAAI